MIRGLLILIFLVVGVASIFAHNIHQYVNSPVQPGAASKDIEITVQPGASFTKVTEQLNQVGIITRPLQFKLLAMYEEKTHKIKSGEYVFNTSQSPTEILDDLASGNTKQYKLTIVEGKRFSDFFDLLKAHPKIEQTLLDGKAVKDKLSIEQASLEGLFFPETYTFTANTKDIEILKQSYDLLRGFLDEEWPKRSEESFVSSPYEALILASIVEKETSAPEERARIAGVFISRLHKRMPLQTDPTVIYGIGDDFDGNLTKKHLQTDTPYNTYTRRGLPPSPISLVSKASLLAVLHPDITGDLFFVSKKDGTHYFSKTYDEHKKAVRKYQLGK